MGAAPCWPISRTADDAPGGNSGHRPRRLDGQRSRSAPRAQRRCGGGAGANAHTKAKSMGERVILFGNGQIASVAYAYLTYDSEHEVVAFTVDRAYRDAPTLFGLPVVPFEEVQDLFPPDQCKML